MNLFTTLRNATTPRRRLLRSTMCFDDGAKSSSIRTLPVEDDCKTGPARGGSSLNETQNFDSKATQALTSRSSTRKGGECRKVPGTVEPQRKVERDAIERSWQYGRLPGHPSGCNDRRIPKNWDDRGTGHALDARTYGL